MHGRLSQVHSGRTLVKAHGTHCVGRGTGDIYLSTLRGKGLGRQCEVRRQGVEWFCPNQMYRRMVAFAMIIQRKCGGWGLLPVPWGVVLGRSALVEVWEQRVGKVWEQRVGTACWNNVWEQRAGIRRLGFGRPINASRIRNPPREMLNSVFDFAVENEVPILRNS